MSIYKTQENALQELIREKKPDCVDALEKEYWQGIGEGLDIREAYWRAEVIHLIRDHEANEKYTGNETDEEVHANYDRAAGLAVEQGDTPEVAERARDTIRHWYDLCRTWGANTALAQVIAYKVAEEIEYERIDSEETEAAVIRAIREIPHPLIQEIALKSFQEMRERGHTLKRAADKAKEDALTLALYLHGGGLVQ